MNSNKLVSIIIPIYNSEKYLPKTLESIIRQDYKDIEIILVNDGSTDNSINICQKYMKIDSRIKLLNQRNLGVSAARNRGVYFSNGQYIAFVDSDDQIEPDMISNLVVLIENNACDVACCNVHIIDKDKTERTTYLEDKIMIYDSYTLLEKFLLGKISHGCWDKLYKRELLEEIDFPLKTTGEDRYFCWEMYKNIKNMVVSPKIGYHYIRRTSNSITSNPLSIKNLSRIEEALKVKNDIILHYPELYNQWEFYYLTGLENLFFKFLKQRINVDNVLYKYFIFIVQQMQEILTHDNPYISESLRSYLDIEIKKL